MSVFIIHVLLQHSMEHSYGANCVEQQPATPSWPSIPLATPSWVSIPLATPSWLSILLAIPSLAWPSRALGEVEWQGPQVNCHCRSRGHVTLMGWRMPRAHAIPRHAPENYNGSWSSKLWRVIQADTHHDCGLDTNK